MGRGSCWFFSPFTGPDSVPIQLPSARPCGVLLSEWGHPLSFSTIAQRSNKRRTKCAEKKREKGANKRRQENKQKKEPDIKTKERRAEKQRHGL